VPLYLLFEISVLMASALARRERRRERKLAATGGLEDREV
jgi:Sec-independent protein secretion pathway component TatC